MEDAVQVARVSEIHRYPVKSMLGERVDEVAVAESGIRGDRIWAVRDEQRGEIEGARKLPELLGCTARFSEPVGASPLPVPQIELPDGDRIAADAPEAASRLSTLCGRTLTLWPRRPADDLDHYRRGTPDHDDMLDELRAIFGRLPGEPLPDIAALPAEALTSATIPGTYYDVYPMFLLTTASLATLQAAQSASSFDARRFRPSLLLESEEQRGFPENEWVGSRLRVGEAVLEIAMECPRCVMTTHGFADLPRDPSVMRTLVKENGGNVGVYASVLTAGVVREGDVVERIA
jgi:uncharacterized protein YcbX